tara:strand:+ start:560 stop:895 length:336 start_codon:yes stop_codon:yes gene_type:complete
MSAAEEIGLGGLAALGTLGTVCAVLLRSAHQNLTTLDTMRRDATAATDRLRKELRDHDNTIFELQAMCADYRYAIAKLEAERDALIRNLKELQRSLNAENTKFKTRPEDVL